MTPTIEAPSAEQGFSNTSDLLDSVFSGDTSQDTGQQDFAAESQPDSGEEQEDPAIAAAEQSDAEAPDPFDLDKILEDDDENEPEQVQENGKNAYRMSESRMQRLVAAKKLADGIAEFAPNVEAAKEHYQLASDFRAMEADFQSPHELVEVNGQQVPAVRAWLDHWAGVSPEGIGAVAEMLPQYLAEVGHHALPALESKILDARVNRLYRQAAISGDPEDLAKAQNADFAFNSKFREKVDPIQRNPQVDTIQRREQMLAQREQQTIDREWKAFDSQNLSGAKQAVLQSNLDKIFEKPEMKAIPSGVLASIREKVAAEVQSRINSNSEWMRNHGIRARNIQREFSDAIRNNRETNLSPQAKALVADYDARIRSEIFAVARPLLKEATQSFVSRNRDTHNRLAASSGKTAPSSGAGGPVRRSIAPPVQQFQSREDALNFAFNQ